MHQRAPLLGLTHPYAILIKAYILKIACPFYPQWQITVNTKERSI